MAISDFGICNNGEAVFECLGMNLPVLVADNLAKYDSYRCLRMDSFLTELNKHIKGEYVPELVGMNFPEKVVELWSEWIIKPRLKFALIDSVFEYLPDFLPFVGDADAFTENRIDYLATLKPDQLFAQEMVDLVDKYKFIAQSHDQRVSEARSGRMRADLLIS